MHIKNYEKYQHYMDGRPMHWIKIMKTLLDDRHWGVLSGDAAKALIGMWLLAIEGKGFLPNDIEETAFRLRIDPKKMSTILDELVHWIVIDDTDCTKPYETVPKRCLELELELDVDKIRDNTLSIENEPIPETKPAKPAQDNTAFETFWKAYPHKVGKPNALKAWNKQKLNESIDIILASLERWKASKAWTKDGGQFIPHPATWLNREGWNDEVPVSRFAADDDDDDINY